MSEEKQILEAIEAVGAEPKSEEKWDVLERVGSENELPDDVIGAYDTEIKAAEGDGGLITWLGERAWSFYEQWSGTDPDVMERILETVLNNTSDESWALERMIGLYTTHQKWTKLLDTYDRAIEISDDSAKPELLSEAAEVARDVASSPERAITYLQKLLVIKANDQRVSSSLERLLERSEKWVELIALWESRLEGADDEEKIQLLEKIGDTWLSKLARPSKTVEPAQELLAVDPSNQQAVSMLRAVLFAEETDTGTRRSAMDLLRNNLENKPTEYLAILKQAVEVADGEFSSELKRELGAQLLDQNDDDAAMDHYASLMASDPEDERTLNRLREIVTRSNGYEKYAGALVVASKNASRQRAVYLKMEAARTFAEKLSNDEKAIGLLEELLSDESLSSRDARMAANRLNELYIAGDKQEERLHVLERLETLETSDSSRRAIIGEMARVAGSLGKLDRAEELWRKRLEIDNSDLWALNALIDLQSVNERWDGLILSLGERVKRSGSDTQRRTDLVKIAKICADNLNKTESAIEAWYRVQEQCGADTETISSLVKLLTAEERWSDLVDLLENHSFRDAQDVTKRLVTLADAQRVHLSSPQKAAEAYGTALAISPADKGALEGAKQLVDDPAAAKQAIDTLMLAFQRTGDAQAFVDLADSAATLAEDQKQQVDVLLSAARLAARELNKNDVALGFVAKVFPLCPQDRSLQQWLLELSSAEGKFDVAVRSLESAAASTEDPRREAEIRFRLAVVCDSEIGDPAKSFASYARVVEIDPENTSATVGAVRTGLELQSYGELCVLVSSNARALGKLPSLVKEELCTEETPENLVTLAKELADQAEQGLSRRAGLELLTLSGELFSNAGETEEAEKVLLRAVEREPRNVEIRKQLIVVQEKNESAGLSRQLLELAEFESDGIPFLARAIEESKRTGDAATLKRAGGSLISEIERTIRIRGVNEKLASQLKSTCDDLYKCYMSEGDAKEATAVLVRASRCDVDSTSKAGYLRRAASNALESNDNSRAMELFRDLLEVDPQDKDAAQTLCELYEQSQRYHELFSLRHLGLDQEKDPTKRVEIRLEINRLATFLEQNQDRVSLLERSLEDMPGHEPTISALASALLSRTKYEELVSLYETQSEVVADADPEFAAELLTKGAKVSQNHLNDVERSVRDFRKGIELYPTAEALTLLSNVYVSEGRWQSAIPWLESLVGVSDEAVRQNNLLLLVKAQVECGKTSKAIQVLEDFIETEENKDQAVDRLAEIYRERNMHEPLADLLLDSLESGNEKRAGEFAREAATLLCEKIKKPSRALPALEKAIEQSEGDVVLRSQYARALRASGRLDEAKVQVDEIIEGYGRRRSPERAEMQLERARILHSQGEADSALDELRQAAAMDPKNADIQISLAQFAKLKGDTKLAEKTYRGLLVMIRRKSDEQKMAVGASEVLFELSQIATANGDKGQAEDLLASAFDASAVSDHELGLFSRALLKHGKDKEVIKAFEMRIATLETPKAITDTRLQLAEILDELEQYDRAYDVAIEAIAGTPDHVRAHEVTRGVARKSGNTKDYVKVGVAAAERLRRKEDPPIIAALLMLAGEALEMDVKDYPGACDLYCRVERTGIREVDALFSIARVSQAQGDEKERDRAVEKLLVVARGEDEQVDEQSRVDASYRLAELMINGIDANAGLTLLKEAFATEPRYAQAGTVLAKFLKQDVSNEDAIMMYERVARRSADKKMLLMALSYKVQNGLADVAEVREAVSLAKSIGKFDKAESLLTSALEIGDEQDWVRRDLALCKVERGAFDGALELLTGLVEDSYDEEIRELCLKAGAEASVDEKNYEYAVGYYQLINEVEPGLRQAWQPLSWLLRSTKKFDGFAELLERSLPAITSLEERNELRVAYASGLYESSGDADAALTQLYQVLDDDIGCDEAAGVLENILVSEKRFEERLEFSEKRYSVVVETGNPDIVADATHRLMQLVDSKDLERRERIYRQALGVAPEDVSLLGGLLSSLDKTRNNDRAEVLEKMLEVSQGASAASVSLSLADEYSAVEDLQSMQVCLEKGWAHDFDNQVVQKRLEAVYRNTENHDSLCKLKLKLAGAAEKKESVSLYLEAAKVYEDSLEQPTKAMICYQKAWEAEPTSESLLLRLVDSMASLEKLSEAEEVLNTGLENYLEGDSRVASLLKRGEIRLGKKKASAALEDFESAWEISPDKSREAFEDALVVAAKIAKESGSHEDVRATVLRRVSLAIYDKRLDEAREVLTEWCSDNQKDKEALLQLREISLTSADWKNVAVACSHLVNLQEGTEQIETAVQLATAAEKAELPDIAVSGLEHVYEAQPDAGEIRLRLKQIYESSSNFAKLATILMSDGEHASKERDAFLNFKRAAEIYLQKLGQAEKAMVAASKALEISPEDHDVTVLYADVLIESGKLEDATTLLEEKIALHKRRSPALGMLQQRMARLSAAQGDSESQLSWLKKAFEVDRRSGEIAAELAQLATETGDYDLALKPLRAITLMDNPEPITRVMALLWEAKIEFARGNNSKAELWAKKALREDPEYAEAQEFLLSLK